MIETVVDDAVDIGLVVRSKLLAMSDVFLFSRFCVLDPAYGLNP